MVAAKDRWSYILLNYFQYKILKIENNVPSEESWQQR